MAAKLKRKRDSQAKFGKFTFALLCLMLLVALMLAYVMRSGPTPFWDDEDYVGYAYLLLNGKFTLTGNPFNPLVGVFNYSFLTIFGVSLFIWLLGPSVFAATLASLLEYLALIAVTFLLARKLLNDIIALVASMFVMVSPVILPYTTRILPDLPLALIASLSLLAFFISKDIKGRKGYLAYFLTGLLIGLTIYVRLDGTIFVVLAAISIFFWMGRRMRLKKFLFLIFGITVAFAFYFGIIFVGTHNPFASLIALTVSNPTTLYDNLNFAINYLFNPFFNYSPSPLANYHMVQYPTGPIIFEAVLCSIIVFAKKDRIWPLALLNLGLALFYLFGSSKISYYAPILLLDVFFTILIPFSSILAAYLIFLVYVAIKKYSGLLAVAVFILLLCITIMFSVIPDISIYSPNVAIRNFIKLYGNALHYTMNVSSGRNITIFTQGDSPYNYQLLAWLITGGNKSVQAIPINLSVPCAFKPDSFVIIASVNYTPLTPSEYLNETLLWAGNTCALERLKTIILNQDYPINISVYRIDATPH